MVPVVAVATPVSYILKLLPESHAIMRLALSAYEGISVRGSICHQELHKLVQVLSLWAALAWVEGGQGQTETVLLLLVDELQEGEVVVVQMIQRDLVVPAVGQEVVQFVLQVS